VPHRRIPLNDSAVYKYIEVDISLVPGTLGSTVAKFVGYIYDFRYEIS